MTSLRRLVALAGVLGVLAALSGVHAEIIEQILVKVNGEILTKTELEAKQIAILRQRGQQLSDDELKKAVAEITPQLLVDTVDEMLLVQHGRDLGYKMSDEQFSGIVENIKKENKIETEEQFTAALKQENMTLADLRKSMEKQMLISRVQQVEVLGRISVTDPEAKAYYDRHPTEFTTPTTLMLRELLVAAPTDGKGINVGLDEEAKAKADALKVRAVAGESFEKLAAAASDSPSKANGGLIGPVNHDEIDPALRKILDGMKVGDVSEVIRTQRGYLMLKLESLTPATALPFDQVRDQIGDRVANERSRGEMEKFIKRLRAEAIIEWKNADLKKLYDQKIAEIAPVVGGSGG
jgi:parvulin-like peptidyl-prolyl isomerase